MARSERAAWMQAAFGYVDDWLAFQVERHRQPGCAIAIARGTELLHEAAFGSADLGGRRRLTPRHRFRLASHSKTWTAAGVLLLREQGRLGLDDPVGLHVQGLPPHVAGLRIADLLSHGAGLTRDGADAGQFRDVRPFLSRQEVLADLAPQPPLAAGAQFKYSNHGYALLGMVIEAVTGQPYGAWMLAHVLRPAGLHETVPDMPHLPARAPMACGHSQEFPFGGRLRVPGDAPCNAIAPAGGFVGTAADTARFHASLDPECPSSVLSPGSRRLLHQRRWRDACNPIELHYGLGLMACGPGPREWWGHTGSLQGFVSRTARFVQEGWTVTVLANANDGLTWVWVDGIHAILSAFRQHGAPASRTLAGWRSRWWSLYGCIDLVPVGDRVLQVAPALNPPLDGTNPEFTPSGPRRAVVTRASGFASPGEAVRRTDGELWIGGSQFLPASAMQAQARALYGPAVPPRPWRV